MSMALSLDARRRQEASEFVKKWTDRCHSKLTHQTQEFLFDISVLLCWIETRGHKKFVFVKRQRLGHILASFVRAIQRNDEDSLSINHAAIKKLFGECSDKWDQLRTIKSARVAPDHPGAWLYRRPGAGWVLIDVQSDPIDPFSVKACASATVFPGEWVSLPV